MIRKTIVLCLVLLLSACDKEKVEKVAEKSKEAKILEWKFGDKEATISGTDIKITLPFGTDITALYADVTLSPKATISPNPWVKRTDYTNPVNFLVTAEDGTTTKKYTVTVAKKSNEAKILKWKFGDKEATISGTDIKITLPFGTDITALYGNAILSPKATITPNPWTKRRDYTNPVNFLVTAEDGTTTTKYTVTVTVAKKSNEAKILKWKFGDKEATISGTDIKITLPFGTDITALYADVTLSPKATISPDPWVKRTDYTRPVNYTVTAEDGTTKQYTVTVTVGKSDQAKITNWKFGDKEATISGTDIKITLPLGTDITALTAKATISPKASISPDETQSRDYTRPVNFLVTAEDGTTTKKYTVTVTIFAKASAEKLTYTKQTITYDDLTTIVGSEDKKATANLIMWGVTGKKDGYTIKKMELVKSVPADIASGGTANGALFIRLKGIAAVTFDLTLKHGSKADATVKNCEIVVQKGKSAVLTYRNLGKYYLRDGRFTTAEILSRVDGAKKDGYSLKEIQNITPADVATVDGKTIKMKKVGKFKADLILSHRYRNDATITGASFEIGKAIAASLTFNKFSKLYTSGGKFTTAEILAKVDGAKDGYTLKSISGLSPAGLATVSGTKPNLRLDFEANKTGAFTATLVLEHATKTDATIRGAQFEIVKVRATSLTFSKLTKVYSSGGKFTKAEIEAQLRPSGSGYALKTMGTLSPSGIATVSGTNLNFVKAGKFDAILVFEHPIRADATIRGAQFEITKD